MALRPKLSDELVENMTEALYLYTGDDKESIRMFVKEELRKSYTPSKISNVVKRKEDLVKSTIPLGQFINKVNDNHFIVSPSGSIYMRSDKRKNNISDFMTYLKEVRSKAKKAMFKAKKENNEVLADNENFRQANAKIKANALSGIMKSAFNVFYDPGNYNAITSTGRTIVTMSATMIEQFCAGNFCFFDINELINHVVLCVRNSPSKERIQEVVRIYNLKEPTKRELHNFLYSSISPYSLSENESEIQSKITGMVVNLDQPTITYIYYYNNLVHLFMSNTEIFKPIIKNMFKGVDIDSSIDPEELFNIDRDLMNIITITNRELIGDAKVDTLPTTNPDIARQLVSIGKKYLDTVNNLQPLFDVFINNSFIPPNLGNKANMFRKSILLLDTDSNIFTVIKWVRWYSEDEFSDNIENYQIASFIVYLISKVIDRILNIFAKNIGVQDSEAHILDMKNEFMYPILILLDIKKNYLGLATVQEGLYLNNPKLDIKGVTLRSSSVCKESRDWFTDVFVKHIFEVGQKSKIDGNNIIKLLVDFENHIRASIYKGETTYLKVTSVRNKEDYKDWIASSYMYAEGWNMIFSEAYDNIFLPTKCTIVDLHKPTPDYLKYLEELNPKVHANLDKFYNTYKKYLNIIAIHPLAQRIPEELIPIINVRKIIYHNVSSAYRILRNLGITIGYKEQTELLYSDVYKFNSDEVKDVTDYNHF